VTRHSAASTSTFGVVRFQVSTATKSKPSAKNCSANHSRSFAAASDQSLLIGFGEAGKSANEGWALMLLDYHAFR